jgi:hypothetical protein
MRIVAEAGAKRKGVPVDEAALDAAGERPSSTPSTASMSVFATSA